MSNNPEAERPQSKSAQAPVTTVEWGETAFNISLPRSGLLITNYEGALEPPQLNVLRNGVQYGTISTGFGDTLEVNAGDVIAIPLTEHFGFTAKLTYFYSGD
jgi:hypothetical protein